TVHVGRRFFFGGEEGVTELLLEVAMQVEIGAARVDHDFAGVVIEKKRYVHALGGDLDPLLILAALLPLPGDGAVVVARPRRDRRNHGVRPHGEAAELDHSHGCAANFGNRRVENETAALQQAEALKEQVDPGAESDDAPEEQSSGVRRTKQQGRWRHWLDPLGLDSGMSPVPRLVERGSGWQQKRVERAY